MERIREVIVVEGINDTKRLQSFFDVDTIETHGLGLKKETIELIEEINRKRGVILFLDPDSPGEKIRNEINSRITGLKNAFVLKEDARTKKKVGIEHADKQVLKEALDNLVTYEIKNESLSYKDYVAMGFMGQDNSNELRMMVSRKYHLGKCNSKTLYKRINMLGIGKEELYDCISVSR